MNSQWRSVFFLAVVLGFLINCSDPAFRGSAPKIGGYHTAPDDNIDGQANFLDIPEGDLITIDFGKNDVKTINRRYLFIRNTGEGNLYLTELILDAQTFIILAYFFGTDCMFLDKIKKGSQETKDRIIQKRQQSKDECDKKNR